MELLNFNVYDRSLEELPMNKEKLIINTINPHSYIVSKSDSNFNKALKNSDILLPDGIGIVKAMKLVHRKEIDKIAGADLHEYLLEYVNSNNGTVFYLGASQNTLEKIFNKYSNITVRYYSPPYKDKFSLQDQKIMIDKINQIKPDVLFLGMTAPKQEKWLNENKTFIDFKVAASIGAVFDFYAGTVKRPSPFWIDLGLEWLPRLLKEPKRLWRRNFISTPLFIFDVFKEKLSKKNK
ncbi:WecB/TagA/CpsF family glycosyltransferase [Flammeovirga aprica]|uniref:WecB/TagA/CpsF family glycosyltransferase n=1 Tax=Flammeovirga aprica JL-4 TaxID=694437 RepID=A0A7X9XCX9_9BACT|nr:WecB/TagA/CpsF family glycosyltransferase [Flammeovirga aprica]NME72220.1 WecB/TagA/CpsF family glycosyltransferase [Flammeovirga aprica JL-4]